MAEQAAGAAQDARTARLRALGDGDPRLAAFRQLFRSGSGASQGNAFGGKLGEGGLRGVCWKVFLGVLPESPDRWSDAIAPQRHRYAELRREWLPDPEAAEVDMDPTLNNPLCPVDDSPWAKVGAPRAGRPAPDPLRACYFLAPPCALPAPHRAASVVCCETDPR